MINLSVFICFYLYVTTVRKNDRKIKIARIENRFENITKTFISLFSLALSSTDSRGMFDFLEDMVGSVENVFSDKSVRSLAKQIKAHDKELQQQREITARLQRTLDEQLTNLNQVGEIVDQTERKSILLAQS